jgi:hypothetical protein
MPQGLFSCHHTPAAQKMQAKRAPLLPQDASHSLQALHYCPQQLRAPRDVFWARLYQLCLIGTLVVGTYALLTTTTLYSILEVPDSTGMDCSVFACVHLPPIHMNSGPGLPGKGQALPFRAQRHGAHDCRATAALQPGTRHFCAWLPCCLEATACLCLIIGCLAGRAWPLALLSELGWWRLRRPLALMIGSILLLSSGGQAPCCLVRVNHMPCLGPLTGGAVGASSEPSIIIAQTLLRCTGAAALALLHSTVHHAAPVQLQSSWLCSSECFSSCCCSTCQAHW